MKRLLKRNRKEISAYLRDKQIECFTFNIIQHHPATKNNDSDKDVCFIEAETNKFLIKHCVSVQPGPKKHFKNLELTQRTIIQEKVGHPTSLSDNKWICLQPNFTQR